MPQPVSITKEVILKNAFRLVREQGYKALTARNLASYMNCSTMPIYSQVENMKALEREVAELSLEELLSYESQEYYGDPLLDSMVGFLRFIIREKELYKVMLLNDDPGQRETREAMRKEGMRRLYDRLAAPKKSSALNKVEIERTVMRLFIYANGLATTYLFNGLPLHETELEPMLIEYYRLSRGKDILED